MNVRSTIAASLVLSSAILLHANKRFAGPVLNAGGLSQLSSAFGLNDSPRLFGLACVVTMMTGVWALSVPLSNVSIIDSFWSLAFVLLNGCYAAHPLTQGGSPARKSLLELTTLLWGVRLSLHLTWRNHGGGEDYRYREFRKYYGANYWLISYVQSFLLQAVLAWLVSEPLLLAQMNTANTTTATTNNSDNSNNSNNKRRGDDDGQQLNVLDAVGVAVWAFGFLMEAVGDYQLARFKAAEQKSTGVLSTGVWAATRHPNYFGNACMWWGWYIVSLAAITNNSSARNAVANALRSLVGPAVMTYLLLNVSGVALLEKGLRRSKGEVYNSYVKSTPAFFPDFTK